MESEKKVELRSEHGANPEVPGGADNQPGTPALIVDTRWTVFGPCPSETLPPADFRHIPSSHGACPARAVKVTGGFVNIGETLNLKQSLKVGAFVAIPLRVLKAGRHRIGMGADWWMEVWFEGKCILSTMTGGNGTYPASLDDHWAYIEADPGEHLLWVRVLGGSSQLLLHVGLTSKARTVTDALEGVRYDDSGGDTWSNAWADDGHVYSLSDDTGGFNGACNSNLAIHRLEGDDPYRLKGVTVNGMCEYGEAGELWRDGCCWKGNGLTCVDGVLYLSVSRHRYGTKETTRHQLAENASIVKSTDHGKTWRRSARENYEDPMFIGRNFGAPFFVKYGQDGRGYAHNADKYVYAVSNNGYWNNGDRMILGRVRRDKIADLNGKDWQFYTGAGKDGMADANWSAKDYAACPIISQPERCGMTGVQYLEGLGIYIMFQWCYPDLATREDFMNYSEWDIYCSPTPWGTWNKVCTKMFKGPGYYNPDVCSKFISVDGTRLILFTSGKFGSGPHYKLIVMPYTLVRE